MNKLSPSLTSFARAIDEKGLTIFDKFTDYFYHDYALKTKRTINTYDNSINLKEKEKVVHKALMEEIMAHAGIKSMEDFKPEVWMTHPMVKWATYAVIGALIDSVLPDVLVDDIGIYTEFRSGDMGDSFSFDVKPYDLFYITKAGRGKRHAELQEQHNGQVTVTPVNHQVTVGVDLYRVLAGKVSLADFVIKAIRSIEAEMTLDAYTAFNTFATGTLNGFTNTLYYSGYSETAFVTVGQTVEAYNNMPAIWLGTKLALANVLPNDANYRYDLTSDYATMGYVRTSAGFDCLEMRQVADWQNATEFSLAISNSYLYCLSPGADKLIKMCREGATWAVVDDAYANADLRQAATFNMSWGTGTVCSAVSGYIAL